jgi:hypothetical protein
MRYETPVLVVIGSASALVQGGIAGVLDNGASETSRPLTGVALGLDD